MDSLSRFRDHPSTPTISINITCVSPMASSLINSPKMIINKINKAIISYIICLKTKKLEELSTSTKNIIKKINRAIYGQILKMKKKQEDDKCLWKKTILMGEKCQPLEFPGAIFYDSEGNQLSERPSTPRSSPSSSFE
jgi:thymidylate synthase ThyX